MNESGLNTGYTAENNGSIELCYTLICFGSTLICDVY